MGMIFVNRDRQSLGQFTEQEASNALASGQLLPDDLAWQEGMEAWVPLSSFENLPPPGASPAVPADPLEKFRNIEPNRMKPGNIRFDECLSKAWETFVKNWGVCVVATIIFFVISIAIQMPMQFAQVLLEKFAGPKGSGDVTMMVAAGAVFAFFYLLATAVSMVISAGLIYFFITALRTKVTIDAMFAGFRKSAWIQILLAGVVWVAAILVLALALLVPGIYLTMTMKSELPAIVSAVLLMIPLAYIGVPIGFVFPLIVDRGIGFREAIMTTFKTVNSQWFSALGILILVGLLAMLGLILCCVGMLATIPIAYLVYAQAYRQMFGDPESAVVD